MTRVTQTELAKRLDVAKSTITRWIQAGRLSPPGADGLMDLELATRERAATESPRPMDQARKAQFDAQKAERRLADATAGPVHREARHAVPGAPQGPIHAPLPLAQGPAAAEPTADPTSASVEKLGMALKLETYKLQKAKAELANLELDQRAGLLVERAEVDFVLADFGTTLRALLEGLPDRLSPVVAGHRGDMGSLHRLIEEHAREIAEQIADHMSRRMAGLDDPQ